MNKSEQINDLASALSKAQGQMVGAKKDSDNPFFKSKYADLASVVEAIRGPFAENGLSYIQAPIPTEGDWVQVETTLLHASGQWVSSIVDVPVSKGDAQGYGSALTYARRYGLSAMAGVAPEDDDGNAAANAKPTPKESNMMPKPIPSTGQPSAQGPLPVAAVTLGAVVFELNGVKYETAGITKALLLETFRLVPIVNKKHGKGFAEDVLKNEFGRTSRKDLTAEQAERYCVRLTEMAEAE